MTKQRVLLLILDGKPDSQQEVFVKAGIEFPKDSVPVVKDFGNYLTDYMGKATLSFGEDGNLYADIEVTNPMWRQNPDLERMTPAVGGVLLQRGSDPRVLEKVDITMVGLSVNKNSDPRILSLGAQALPPTLPCTYCDDPDSQGEGK